VQVQDKNLELTVRLRFPCRPSRDRALGSLKVSPGMLSVRFPCRPSRTGPLESATEIGHRYPDRVGKLEQGPHWLILRILPLKRSDPDRVGEPEWGLLNGCPPNARSCASEPAPAPGCCLRMATPYSEKDSLSKPGTFTCGFRYQFPDLAFHATSFPLVWACLAHPISDCIKIRFSIGVTALKNLQNQIKTKT
jgi:hypothetical protein